MNIKTISEQAYGHQALKRTQIYGFMTKMKEGGAVGNNRGSHCEKARTAALFADIAAEIKKDGCITIRELDIAFGVSKDIIHKVLHEELGLSKKSARWVPKLFPQEQTQERVRVCRKFVAAVYCHSMT